MAADQPATVLTWTSISDACTVIGRQVSADGIPDVIVGVIRGGMIPAVLLSHTLACRDVRGISLACTQGEGVNAAKAPRPVLANPGSAGQVTGLDVLIADDVAGSGATARTATALLREAGAARIRLAVCAVNSLNWPTSGPSPGEILDYVGGYYQGWVVFPWER